MENCTHRNWAEAAIHTENMYTDVKPKSRLLAAAEEGLFTYFEANLAYQGKDWGLQFFSWDRLVRKLDF